MTPRVQSQPVAVSTGEKLSGLRALMQRHGLDGYVIPSSDEHLNEYLPEHQKRREWVSGFSGSAGDALVTLETAWAFVDSRYYEQADLEVDTRLVQVSKLGLDGQPNLGEAIKQAAEGKKSFRVGFDPSTLALEQFNGLAKRLARTSVEWVPVGENLVDALWVDGKPAAVAAEIFGVPDAVSGESFPLKLKRVREAMATLGAQVLPVIKLDQVAWLFNLRGQDIPYNPVFLSYAVLTPKEAYLFTDSARIRPEDLKALKGLVTLLPYGEYGETLKRLGGPGAKVLIDPELTPYGTFLTVQSAGGEVIEAAHPVQRMKALKNPTEIKGMQSANLKASRAKIRALKWLDDQLKAPPYTTGGKENARPVKAGQGVTEESFRLTIERFYAEEPEYFGLSFNTISGAGANSSIVHYGTPDPNKTLQRGELFLIDSGTQFYHGTTDDTRTVIFGKPSLLQKKRYTEVVKAHINCAMQRFPKGTEGIRLDGITRATMWNAGLDFGHGTGHGVGAFLNVHEGPNGIHRMAKEPFQPGMITSIEPGFYAPGWGGIRVENLYFVKELTGFKSADGRPWYGFESLTYVPFDKRLILKESLNKEQLRWLKAYHAAIVRKVAPSLSRAEAAWLRRVCAF